MLLEEKPQDGQTKYNTAYMPWRIGVDIVSALCASTLVAPLITVIDKTIIQNTHKPSPLSSLFLNNLTSALRHPLAFLTSAPYLIVTSVYFSTYLVANLTDNIQASIHNSPSSTITHGASKFFSTSAVNMGLSLVKDARFAKVFGKAAAGTKRAVPVASMALFAARDSATIFASFNLPPVLGPMLGSENAAQFLAPAGIQLLSTPLHLLGLDLYNRPNAKNTPAAAAATTAAGADGMQKQPAISMRDRFQIVRRDWLVSSLARMGRIVPAFGVGGVVNRTVRGKLLDGY